MRVARKLAPDLVGHLGQDYAVKLEAALSLAIKLSSLERVTHDDEARILTT
jgi:hypothetical protein